MFFAILRKCERCWERNGEVDYVSGFPLAAKNKIGGWIYGSRFIETQSGGL